jgi:hypothetical protein
MNPTEREVRLVVYRVAGFDYWVATDHHDPTAEQVTFAYKLRFSLTAGNAI